MSLFFRSSLVLSSLFVAGLASADESPPVAADSPATATGGVVSKKRIETRLTMDAGAFKDDHAGGVVVGGELLHRRGLLALAAVGEYGATVFTPYTYAGGAGGAGVSLPMPAWIRVDILGLFGLHRYDGVGGSGGGFPVYGPQDDGVAATLPSMGARLSTTFELGGRARFVIGLKALVDRDLGEATKTHTATFPLSSPVTTTSTIGGTRLAGLLTLGGAFGD